MSPSEYAPSQYRFLGLAQKRRKKLVLAILGLIALLLLAVAVTAALADPDRGLSSSTRGQWLWVWLAATFGFLVVISTIFGVVKPDPEAERIREPWRWLAIPVVGVTVGLICGLFELDSGFWFPFLTGFGISTGVSLLLFLSIALGVALRRFVQAP